MRFILIFFITFGFHNSYSQTFIPEHYFAKTYSIDASYGGNIFQLNDKGFISSATNLDTVLIPNTTNTIIIEVVSLLRTDSKGETVWAKNYDLNSNCAYGGGFVLAKDSGYAFVTVYTTTAGTNPDYLLFKTDKNGNVLWNHRYGASGNEFAMGVVQDVNENFFIGGYSDSHLPGNGDFHIVKTDKNGNMIWSNTYGLDTTYEFPTSIVKDFSNNCLVYGTGAKYVNDSLYYPTYVVLKTDNNGNIIYFKRFFLTGTWETTSIYLYNATTLSDNSLLMIGTKDVYTNLVTYNSVSDIIITKLDSLGNTVWNKELYIPNDTTYYLYPSVVKETKNQEFILMGNMVKSPSYDYLTFYAEFDKNGGIKKFFTYPTSLMFSPLVINSTMNNTGNVVLGIDFAQYGNAILKIDTLGELGSCYTYQPVNLQSSNINFVIESGGYKIAIGYDSAGIVTSLNASAADTSFCFRTDSVLYIPPIEPIINYPSFVDVPTAFTPNGDGINDVIYVAGFGIKKINYFKIFNRWGQILFESTNLLDGWDGKYNGVQQNTETYVFQVSVDMANSDKINKNGTFKLIR